MPRPELSGLIAASYTPMSPDGGLNLGLVHPLVDHLLASGVDGLYVCGSTGEGMSLSSDERRAVAQAYVEAAGGRAPVVIQVGHNSVTEARQLAEHAQQIGADAISATCPSYFKIDKTRTLVHCMQEIAAGAPELPFYYYHIPAFTGSSIPMADFLQQAAESIANLRGLKYTAPLLHEFQECLCLDEQRFDVLWGTDEMLLGAWATGARGAIGSTYNIMAPLYRQLIDAFEAQDLSTARQRQAQAWRIIKTIARYPFHSAMKAVLAFQGFPVGPCRTPQQPLTDEQASSLRRDLEAVAFLA